MADDSWLYTGDSSGDTSWMNFDNDYYGVQSNVVGGYDPYDYRNYTYTGELYDPGGSQASQASWYSPIFNWLGSNPQLAGALGAGALGYLVDRRANRKSTPVTTTTTTQLPPWWEESAEMGALAARYLPEYQSQLGIEGTQLSNTDIGQYMNPFVQQTLDPVLRNMGIEQAQEQQALAANAVKAGAFGGMRPYLQQDLALERQGRRRDEAIGAAYKQAFDTAAELAQKDIDFTRADLMRQYQSPFAQVGALGEYLARTRGGEGSTQSQSGGQYVDPLKGALGAGMTAYGLMRG